jgi:hypothetical protein
MQKPGALVVVVSLLVLHSQPAFAATRESKERAAMKACLKGDPEKGVSILTDLFVDTEDLTYIFNQGRCFEQNRRYDDAVGRFREYLIKGKNLSSEDKGDAERHIAACLSYLGKDGSQETPANQAVRPVPAPGPELPQTAEAATPRTDLVAAAANPPPAAHPGRTLRIAGITVGAVGAAALIGGVALNLKANSMSKDLAKPDNYSRSTDSTRRDYETLGWASYGVGAAGIATGAILCFLGSNRGSASAHEVALMPTLGAGIAGASVTGAF